MKQPNATQVRRFWRKLFDCWKRTPAIDIREFRQVLNWLEALACNNIPEFREMSGDLIPTISSNGELRVLSPELAEVYSEKYSNFVIGNVVDKDFSHLIKAATQQLYYIEFNQGRYLCYKICDYFSYCCGGSASNKLSENGDLKSTETTWCINSKKNLVDAVLEVLMEECDE